MTKRATTKPQWAIESGCLGKQLFTSSPLAREVAHDGAVQPYRCSACDGWHVGSKNRSR